MKNEPPAIIMNFSERNRRSPIKIKRKPINKLVDDKFRKLPGLLSETSREYNPFHFASSNASFGAVKAFYNEVAGEVNPETIAKLLEKAPCKLCGGTRFRRKII